LLPPLWCARGGVPTRAVGERIDRQRRVGCGPGALGAVLVDRLGAARVSAAYPSAPFIDACRARLPGVDVVEAGAEALPFAAGAFDAALSQLVVNFMHDG
jgi:trans-aconitate methyltransferase